jgi:hypothetical protein
VPPKADYDATVRGAVLDRLLRDRLNVEQTKAALVNGPRVREEEVPFKVIALLQAVDLRDGGPGRDARPVHAGRAAERLLRPVLVVPLAQGDEGSNRFAGERARSYKG